MEEIDGCDLLASHAALQRAVDHARQRKGPALDSRARDSPVLALAVRRRSDVSSAGRARAPTRRAIR